MQIKYLHNQEKVGRVFQKHFELDALSNMSVHQIYQKDSPLSENGLKAEGYKNLLSHFLT